MEEQLITQYMYNTKAPLVSVIIAFLNEEKFLAEAVESVLRQDYENWEILLVDDGSTDGSTSIAKEYVAKFPGKIVYCEHGGHSNRGLSASRNLGIAQAKGELVTFLDADDVWLPAYLSNQVRIMQQQLVVMVCEATEYWFSWNDEQRLNTTIPIGTEQNRLYVPPQLLLNLYPLGVGAAPCVCGVIVQKEVLEKHGGFDEAFTGMYEDQVFLSKFYLNESIYISSSCNNRYRQRTDSLVGSSRKWQEYNQIRGRYLKWLEKYMQDHAICYPSVNNLLQKALQPPPLVSVIIAFLNEEKFLAEALESVLRQDYENWEILLVDDGSTDGSTAIAKEYVAKFPGKIVYCEHGGHSNRGLSASRNLGIAQAKGELIAFLDADDVWLPEKLSDQVYIFQQHPEIGMVAEGSHHWYSWNDPKKRNFEIPVGAPQDEVYDPFDLSYLLYPLGKGAAPGPCALMLKKEAISRIGGFEESFTKQYQLYEDQAFLAKVYLHEKVFISSNLNNLYRQRPGSLIKWVKEEGHYHTVRKYFLEWLAAYLQQKGIKDKYLWSLLRKALFPYHHPVLFYIKDTAPRQLAQMLKKFVPLTIKRFIKTRVLVTRQA
jgi:glycosyltransferase involved in cell wall biosynthesis